MKNLIYLALNVAIAFCGRAQNLDHSVGCATNPPDFSKLSYQEASVAVNMEARNTICPEYFTNLIREIKFGNLDNEKLVLALYLLGELHPVDSDSIDTLLQFIDIKATRFDPKTSFPRWGWYPAKDALIKIGKPIIRPALAHLTDETKNLRRQLMCDALIRTEGKNGTHFSETNGKSIVRDQINKILASETDEAKRSNLAAAMKDVENWKLPGL